MFYAEKGNRVIEIDENSFQRYAEQGYKIVDERGAVVIDTVPTDLPTLALAYKKCLNENKSLHAQLSDALAEIDKLNAEINGLKSAKVSAEKAVNDEATTKQGADAPKETKSTKRSKAE